jgi:hypothetical protein
LPIAFLAFWLCLKIIFSVAFIPELVFVAKVSRVLFLAVLLIVTAKILRFYGCVKLIKYLKIRVLDLIVCDSFFIFLPKN